MKKIIAAFIVIGTIFSCTQPSSEKTLSLTAKSPVDTLIRGWENNWNRHDSAAVRNMFATDAILIDDNLVLNGADELSEKWIHTNIAVVKNLNSTKLQEWSSDDRAGYIGKYELDVVIKDSVVAKPKGVYSVNWTKTGNGDWNITAAHIHSFSDKK